MAASVSSTATTTDRAAVGEAVADAGGPLATPVRDGLEQTRRLAVHPSTAVPGVPPFVFAVPDGWVLDEAPGALAVIRPAEQIDDFWVNAILSHDRVARSVDFRQAAAFTWDRIARQAPDTRVEFEQMFRRDDLVFYLRGSSLTAPRSARPVAQLHAIFFAPVTGPGKLVDFFQLVGTAPVDVMPTVGPLLFDLITSFRFV